MGPTTSDRFAMISQTVTSQTRVFESNMSSTVPDTITEGIADRRPVMNRPTNTAATE